MISRDHPRQALRDEITSNSEVLPETLTAFKNLMESRKVASFYEVKQTREVALVKIPYPCIILRELDG